MSALRDRPNVRSAGPVGLLLAGVGGLLYALGFAGFGIWPLACVALTPAFALVETAPSLRRVAALGAVYGMAAGSGGYYWLVPTLQDHSGFPLPVCVLLAALVCLYHSGPWVLLMGLAWQAHRRGWRVSVAAVPALCSAEFVYPLLFPNYLANSFHELTPLVQIVDLGGPLLLSGMAALVNAAFYELLRGRLLSLSLGGRVDAGPPWQRRALWTTTAASLLLSLAYGQFRLQEAAQREANAHTLRVGLVQTNMGIYAKHREPLEGLKRHLSQSRRLEREAEPDLLLWPETAVVWPVPARATSLKPLLPNLKTPLLAGALSWGAEADTPRLYNSAFLIDAGGEILGRYDKIHRLAYSEYIPLGDWLPSLYRFSPSSRHIAQGRAWRSLQLGRHRIATLICYEDILPDFVRTMVRATRPHVLVNLTNDAWFGDTHEPWIHLALAKFRAVEHHRYLLRVTNTGVSAVVDSVGRVATHSGVFERASLHATVPMLEGWTPYQSLGDWPGWLALAISLGLAFGPRRTRLVVR